ncbi:MAG: hypothetical protein ACFWTY_01100 [Shouchella clausii]|jgi:hypothetical protein
MDRHVLCLWERVGNFTYGKVYKATPRAVRAHDNKPTCYYVTDDEGDYYTITDHLDRLHRKWRWVEEGKR